MTTLQSLIHDGILKFAQFPPGNPQTLDFPSYTIPLIEHDYPAKTPVMWNEVYEKFDIPTRNVMMVADPKNTELIFEVFRKDEHYFGGGAGVGFKDESPAFLDEMDSLAKAVGSVNFILKTSDNKLRGYNTDGVGYAQSLAQLFAQRGFTLTKMKVVMLGAGGTANSIAFALADFGARLVILNRTVEKAQALAQAVNQFYKHAGARFGGEEDILSEVRNADVILNVSTKGATGPLEEYSALAPAQLPATRENIQANHNAAMKVFSEIPLSAIISDINLTKSSTPLLRTAAQSGFTTLDGLPMVINQGVEALWLLHGSELEEKGVTKTQVKDLMTKAATKS